MYSLLDHYRVLGVSVGAGMADVTSSYKRLCRLYHPDVNNDPESEELMKRINIAYAVLREKLKREAAWRERTAFSRTARRYTDAETRAAGAETRRAYAEAEAEAEREAYSTIHSYFKAISAFDYSGAYDYLSAYDKRRISRESFIEWRTSVARLYPMREFKIESSSTPASVKFNDEKTLQARKFFVMVTEEDFAENSTSSDGVEKLVINENGRWRLFLGYKSVYDLTRTFDERFEAGRKLDIARRFDEYFKELCPEYDMYSLAGFRKAASHEIYRQKRFGGTLTFAAISVRAGGLHEAGRDELLRSAAKVINNTLRETDIPAYAGDGVFAILFVELRKKNAEYIIDRITKKIRGAAGPQLGGIADIDFAFESWSGNSYAEMGAIDKILEKFCKKQ
ncbi:MAG: DnaJ domain-containing protein [Oscillospiraceae bacterium]|nr:DnaJ domain-containing protein [Oscillospiraceae bacterium]